MPIYAGKEILYFLAPFLISIPTYIVGRKLFFKKYKQSEMHLIKSGKIFTAIVGLIHIVLMVVLFFIFE